MSVDSSYFICSSRLLCNRLDHFNLKKINKINKNGGTIPVDFIVVSETSPSILHRVLPIVKILKKYTNDE